MLRFVPRPAHANPQLNLGIGWLLLLLLFFCGTVKPASAQAEDQVGAQHLSVNLLMPPAEIYPGQSFTAGIDFKIEPGWHIYWQNAGDSGEPPSAQWSLSKGISAGPLQFPAPERLPLGPLMDYGYENEVVLPVSFHVDPHFHGSSGHATFTAKVFWLVCQNVCMPGQATLTLTRPALSEPPTTPTINIDTQQKISAYQARLPQSLPRGAKARFEMTQHGIRLTVLLGYKVTAAQFFPLDQNQIANAAPQGVELLARGVALTLTPDSTLTGKLDHLHGVLEVDHNSVAYFIDAKPGTLPAAFREPAQPLAIVLRAMILALLGGMLLNLMPCVFPVLFIKGLALVNSSQHERRTLRAHGWVYTLGIILSFWAVLALLLTLRAAGEQLGWGFQFQSPMFLALIAMLLFFFGLSLAGQFELGLTLTSAGGSLAQKQGYAGSFFTGVLAMIVATPCTAPLMGPAIGYALAHSALTSFAVFTALGLGLALPYLILAYQPAWTQLLPRPGAWMELLKQAISIPIFATAIWMIWLYTEITGSNAMAFLLAALLLLAIAGWVLGRWPAQRKGTIAAILLVALSIALPWYAGRVFGQTTQNGQQAGQSQTSSIWQPYTPERLADALAAHQPVFVDFTADWCLSCQVNQRLVLDRADVQKRLEASHLLLLKADWTHHDPAITEALRKLGRSGIPTYVIYSAQPNAEPMLLPEVITPSIVFAALDSMPKDAMQKSNASIAPKS